MDALLCARQRSTSWELIQLRLFLHGAEAKRGGTQYCPCLHLAMVTIAQWAGTNWPGSSHCLDYVEDILDREWIESCSL